MPNLTSSPSKADTAALPGTTPFEETPLAAKYASLAAVATRDGATVHSYLGAALGAASALPAGLQQRYERGAIVARKTGGAFVVYGDI